MKRLIIIGLVFGPALLMGQKKEDIVAIQRDLANLEDEVRQLKTAQDEKMAALQNMLQQAVDASGRVTSGLAAIQKELDSRLADQQNKLVAPLATLGAKVDQTADDTRSASVNIADLMRKMDTMNGKLEEMSAAIRTLQSGPVQPPGSATGATGGTGAGGGTSPQVPAAPAMNCDTSYQNAYRDYSTGKQDLAMKEFNDIVPSCPGTDTAANAQYYIGWMYYNAQQWDDAAKAFDVLLTFNENSKTQDGLYYKAVALLKAEHRTAAANTFKEFIRRYPNSEHVPQAKKDLQLLGMPVSRKR